MTSQYDLGDGRELVDARLAQASDPEVQEREGAEPDSSGVYLDLYKLAVEMADRVSVRRATANTFFLTVHAALLTFLNVAHPTTPVSDGASVAGQSLDKSGLVMVAIVGLLLAAAWWVMLKSYRNLNRAKFLVINAMEEQLPAQVFTQEWRHLNTGRVGFLGRYTELGTIERVVPLVFGGMYLLTIALILTV
jgi:hypothetical protein